MEDDTIFSGMVRQDVPYGIWRKKQFKVVQIKSNGIELSVWCCKYGRGDQLQRLLGWGKEEEIGRSIR